MVDESKTKKAQYNFVRDVATCLTGNMHKVRFGRWLAQDADVFDLPAGVNFEVFRSPGMKGVDEVQSAGQLYVNTLDGKTAEIRRGAGDLFIVGTVKRIEGRGNRETDCRMLIPVFAHSSVKERYRVWAAYALGFLVETHRLNLGSPRLHDVLPPVPEDEVFLVGTVVHALGFAYRAHLRNLILYGAYESIVPSLACQTGTGFVRDDPFTSLNGQIAACFARDTEEKPNGRTGRKLHAVSLTRQFQRFLKESARLLLNRYRTERDQFGFWG